MYQDQDYKHDFYLGKLLLSRGSLTSECNSPLLLEKYRCTDCKHSAAVCTHFFFLLLFLGEKDTAHCIDVVHRHAPMPTSPNDMESINGMVSDYWNIYCEVEIIYRSY